MIRIFAGNVPRDATEDQAVAWAIEGIKESLPYAAKKGVTLALENHGGITATPRQILKLVKAVDGPNFGVNLDTGNFNGEDPYAEIAELAPYAVNVQVKTEIHRKGAAQRGSRPGPADRHPPRGPLRGVRRARIRGRGRSLSAIPRHIKKLRELIS